MIAAAVESSERLKFLRKNYFYRKISPLITNFSFENSEWILQ